MLCHRSDIISLEEINTRFTNRPFFDLIYWKLDLETPSFYPVISVRVMAKTSIYCYPLTTSWLSWDYQKPFSHKNKEDVSPKTNIIKILIIIIMEGNKNDGFLVENWGSNRCRKALNWWIEFSEERHGFLTTISRRRNPIRSIRNHQFFLCIESREGDKMPARTLCNLDGNKLNQNINLKTIDLLPSIYPKASTFVIPVDS